MLQACWYNYDSGDMHTSKLALISQHIMRLSWRCLLTESFTCSLQGSVAITGAAVKWLRDNVNMISKASEIGKMAKTHL